jgi:serine/threonine-protein kinase
VSVALKHVNDEPVPPRTLNPAIPPALEAVILKAMQKDPTRRYRSADDMRDDLQRVVAGRSVHAQPRVDDTTVMPIVGERTSKAPDITRPNAQTRDANPWIWVAIAVLVVLLGLGLAYGTGLLGGSGLRVPDTTGMSAVDAKKALVDVGLTVGAEETTFNATVPKDAVISTTPSAGTSVGKGSAVDLLVSAGPELVAVLDVVGSGETTAVQDLQKAGFAVDPIINREFNSKYPAGIVFKTDPAVGTNVAKGGKISLWVSQGAEMITVPAVANLLQADATKQLKDAGFSVKVTTKSDGAIAKGTVISQKPIGGAQAPKGSTVTITVSSGLEQVVVPPLLGLTQAEAVAKIQALGLVDSDQTIQDADPSHTGLVQNQDPVGGTKVNKGSTVTIWVATP